MEHKDFAVNLARRAGEMMVANFVPRSAKTFKADFTPLTVTDTAINKMVNEAVSEEYPGHAVVGEEASVGDAAMSDYVWVCDPIDGTVPFSHGMPTSTFMLALVHEGTTEVGVIFDPFLERLCVAERGKGTTLGGSPTHVSKDAELAHTVLDFDSPVFLPHGGAIAKRLYEQGAMVQTFLSVGYGGLLVACGELSAAIYGGSNCWDAAAIDIVVREAGGKATSLDGTSERQDRPIHGLIASNGLVHDSLLASFSADRTA